MDWLLSNTQMYSTFSSLGAMQGDVYVVNPEALALLEEINTKLSSEDPELWTFRRSVGFGQNVKLDLIPLLINAKDNDIINATIRILVNLTVPIECLVPLEHATHSYSNNCIIFELNKLLSSIKEAFKDSKSTKAVLDHMKSILETDSKLSLIQCDNVNNCLLLIRNILHIPEMNAHTAAQGHHSSNNTSMQNILLWNLFIQSIDKLLIYLLSSPQRPQWGVTMVQLIALMYKDQHVSTLQKLLNMWFESSLSESSEDNESNTSPPKEGSGDSSPMLTSDPTSDSSDNGGCGNQANAEERWQVALNKDTESTLQEVSWKGQEYQNSILRNPDIQQSHTVHQNICYSGHQGLPSVKYSGHEDLIQIDSHTKIAIQCATNTNSSSPGRSEIPKNMNPSNKGQNTCSKCAKKRDCPSSQSDHSDCGYGTQVDNHESISTSSNEEDGPQKKHKPPSNQKQRYNGACKQRNVSAQDKKEWRRKKLVKRSKSSLINMKGLVQHIPTDEDISNILKEFTVDFLLKGYRYLVQVLHVQLLSDLVLIDRSHFFWLVTYFLKFAAQLELDLEHVNTVLSYDILSYLTFEGVCLSEQLEIPCKQKATFLKPHLRRIHLVVTAIREFLQALETYKKITHLSQEDRYQLQRLEAQICSTEDLRCLFVLLLRTYNPALYSKQYLQDLIVTNHLLLLLLDEVSKTSKSKINFKMMEHLEQFATVEIMYHYGLLLEDFQENGEFVNDCIFTMMHHIGGDLEQVGVLYQPNILKTFSKIWETEYGICDDWSDLIEYVIHKFMNTQKIGSLPIPLPTQALPSPSLTELTKEHNMDHPDCTWTQEENDSLNWYFAQSKKCKDLIGNIAKLFRDNGNVHKTRTSIMHQLLQQDTITLIQYDDLMQFEDSQSKKDGVKLSDSSTSIAESGIEIKDPESLKISDDIQMIKNTLIKDNKRKLLLWLQKVLIECCYVKMYISSMGDSPKTCDNANETPIMEAVPYHCILKNKSIPLVPWASVQGLAMGSQPFVLLLHKLGLHLPTDVGNAYARIPNFWTADILYMTAQKLGPIDKNIIKFDLNKLCGVHDLKLETYKPNEDSGHESFAIPRVKHSNSVIRFTPDPASTPSVPNWLQLVMRSKCTPSDRMEHESSPTGLTPPFVMPAMSSSFYNMPSTSKMQQTFSDDDCIMRAIDEISDGGRMSRRRSSNMDSGISAGVLTTVYDHDTDNDNEMLNCETTSVASDLTRMYVSDEEDKHA